MHSSSQGKSIATKFYDTILKVQPLFTFLKQSASMGLFKRKKQRKEDGAASEKTETADIPQPMLNLLNAVEEMDRKPPVTLVLIGADTLA
jgi:hypothetical protein